MITGGHVMIYDRDAPAMRGFLRTVLALPAVDAGNGRWMMRVPPTEIGVHETDGERATNSISSATTSRRPSPR